MHRIATFLTVVFVSMLCSGHAFAQRLILYPSATSLLVLLENDLPVPVIVADDLSVHSPLFDGGVRFHIRDDSDRVFPLMVKICESLSGSMPRVELLPSEAIGRRFEMERLADYYDLPDGTYRISALYLDPEGRTRIQSDSVEIAIEKSGRKDAAEPGATDNPDGAQRLREDY